MLFTNANKFSLFYKTLEYVFFRKILLIGHFKHDIYLTLEALFLRPSAITYEEY